MNSITRTIQLLIRRNWLFSSLSLLSLVTGMDATAEGTPSNKVIVPDVAVIGTRWSWQGNFRGADLIASFPTKVCLDYNPDGEVYALSCEYPADESLFEQLKKTITESLSVTGITEGSSVIWRKENQKVSVSVLWDRDEHVIRLEMASLDPKLRRGKLKK